MPARGPSLSFLGFVVPHLQATGCCLSQQSHVCIFTSPPPCFFEIPLTGMKQDSPPSMLYHPPELPLNWDPALKPGAFSFCSPQPSHLGLDGGNLTKVCSRGRVRAQQGMNRHLRSQAVALAAPIKVALYVFLLAASGLPVMNGTSACANW